MLIGLVLVLTSVVVGSTVVAAADDRTAMYAAREALVPGQPLTEDDLVRVDVQLGSQRDRYLSAGSGLAPDRYVLREVAAGELVPAVAVGSLDQVTVQALTLSVDAGSVAALTVGSRVDVYVNPADPRAAGNDAFTGPVLALEGVSVARLPKTSGGLSGGAGGDRPVQVMAPKDRIKDIIGKVDDGARVTLVPAPGSGGGGS
ncbi:CpaB family protein [Pedococcus soli]